MPQVRHVNRKQKSTAPCVMHLSGFSRSCLCPLGFFRFTSVGGLSYGQSLTREHNENGHRLASWASTCCSSSAADGRLGEHHFKTSERSPALKKCFSSQSCQILLGKEGKGSAWRQGDALAYATGPRACSSAMFTFADIMGLRQVPLDERCHLIAASPNLASK